MYHTMQTRIHFSLSIKVWACQRLPQSCIWFGEKVYMKSGTLLFDPLKVAEIWWWNPWYEAIINANHMLSSIHWIEYEILPTSVDCGPPLAPRNGSLESYTNTTEGSVVFYSCDPGFGPEHRMMSVWTGTGWSPNPGALNCSLGMLQWWFVQVPAQLFGCCVQNMCNMYMYTTLFVYFDIHSPACDLM